MSSTASTSPLLTPYEMGPFKLKNRVIMAPLTRLRAGPGQVPTPLNALYYQQRASAGFIIGEATWICQQGYGYPNSPGIETAEQVEGHNLITNAVHEKDGIIFLQLWHVGRISHPSLQPNNQLPVAPSALRPTGQANTLEGPQPFVTPRALETEEMPGVVEAYRHAAANAKSAGYDGIEVHAANGYLLEEFLCDGTNKRTDAYGGSIENRFRLLKEVMEACIEVFGADRVGIRLSPTSTFNDITDSDRATHMAYVITELNKMNLAYLHLVEPRVEGSRDVSEDQQDLSLSTKHWRGLWKGTLIGAGGYDKKMGEEVIKNGQVDLVCYGRLYIPNPDLVERFAEEPSVLRAWDRSTFYGGGPEGYTDFLTLEEERKGKRN